MATNLALFDFDGTITNKDSFIEFIKFYKGKLAFYSGVLVLSPVLVLYKLGIIKNHKAKELVFTYFFRNESLGIFRSKCCSFSLTGLQEIVKPTALKAIEHHFLTNDRVIVISASFEEVLSEWCNSRHLDLIGTKIEIKDDLITGKILGKNCYGIEKLNRLRDYLDISEFGEISVYGDSKGDLPLMQIADHKYYRFL
jgi:phosphatidylglycerophosphatase C